ncbi:hypothetical protein B0H13DRAFT_1872904 [Mycena leptocephala]|nr:hypothetical protein B0H13DRAFT_1872904 [Mycena leptocephala]
MPKSSRQPSNELRGVWIKTACSDISQPLSGLMRLTLLLEEDELNCTQLERLHVLRAGRRSHAAEGCEPPSPARAEAHAYSAALPPKEKGSLHHFDTACGARNIGGSLKERHQHIGGGTKSTCRAASRRQWTAVNCPERRRLVQGRGVEFEYTNIIDRASVTDILMRSAERQSEEDIMATARTDARCSRGKLRSVGLASIEMWNGGRKAEICIRYWH